MTRRNFILFVIVLLVVLGIVLGILYSKRNVPPINDDGGINFIAKYNPFATSPTPNPSPEQTPDNTEGIPPAPPEETVPLKLVKVSTMPVAGFGVYKKERLIELAAPVPGEIVTLPTGKPTPPTTEFATALRYTARVDGNIYQTFADKVEERKFSTTVIPKIYEAFFGNKAESVIMRYLKPDGQTVETFLGSLPKELLAGDSTENNEVKGTFLPSNVSDLSVSPDAQKIFYLFGLGDGVVGTTQSLVDGKKVQVFDSAFTEWLSQWPKSNVITLNTKPSANVPGYLFMIDLDRKTTTRALGDINGLTTLTSPNGKLVLYSSNDLALKIYHTDTRVSDLIGIKTLPEKCVWGSLSDTLFCAVPKSLAGTDFPDIWYKGEVSFADQIWKIDLINGTTTMIEDPSTTVGEEVDAIKLAIDDVANYLFFVNKKDSFLWELGLK